MVNGCAGGMSIMAVDKLMQGSVGQGCGTE